MRLGFYYKVSMVKPKPYGDILKELKDKFESQKRNEEKFSSEKCKKCNCNMMAIGKSTIPGVCSICVNLALL